MCAGAAPLKSNALDISLISTPGLGVLHGDMSNILGVARTGLGKRVAQTDL